MISAGGGPQRTLAVLEASGVSSSLVHWERLLVISYATLVEPRSNIVDVGGKKGRHVAVFLDHLRADRVYVFEPNPEMCAILHRRYRRAAQCHDHRDGALPITRARGVHRQSRRTR